MQEGRTHGWEPLSWTLHDQPQLVKDYFASINLDFIQYLSVSQKRKHRVNKNAPDSSLPRLDMTTTERNAMKRKKRFELSEKKAPV